MALLAFPEQEDPCHTHACSGRPIRLYRLYKASGYMHFEGYAWQNLRKLYLCVAGSYVSTAYVVV